jgi:hypothetical protein
MPRKEANHMPDKDEDFKEFRKKVHGLLGEDVEVTDAMYLELSDGRGQDNER